MQAPEMLSWQESYLHSTEWFSSTSPIPLWVLCFLVLVVILGEVKSHIRVFRKQWCRCHLWIHYWGWVSILKKHTDSFFTPLPMIRDSITSLLRSSTWDYWTGLQQRGCKPNQSAIHHLSVFYGAKSCRDVSAQHCGCWPWSGHHGLLFLAAMHYLHPSIHQFMLTHFSRSVICKGPHSHHRPCCSHFAVRCS